MSAELPGAEVVAAGVVEVALPVPVPVPVPLRAMAKAWKALKFRGLSSTEFTALEKDQSEGRAMMDHGTDKTIPLPQ